MKNLNKLFVYCIIGITALSLALPISAKTIGEIDKEGRAKYQTVRQQYLREVNFYNTARQQFLDAQTKYKNFQNVENKKAYEDQARMFLEKAVDTLIKKLETLKNWISNKRNITEEEKQEMIEEIDQDISWLQNKKIEISDAAPAQIREEAREVREYWKNHKVQVKKIIGRIWEARLSWTIEKFENASVKVELKIEELKEAGKDISQLETLLDDFNNKIDLAKEKRDKAEESWQSIEYAASANQLFNQTKNFIIDANTYLKQARQILSDIIKEMKEINNSETE